MMFVGVDFIGARYDGIKRREYGGCYQDGQYIGATISSTPIHPLRIPA